MKIKSGIYRWRNIVDGKIYIGSSTCLFIRRNGHIHALRHDKHHNKKLQNAFNKYGETNFKFEILEFITQSNNESNDQFKLRLAKEREQHYLDTLLFASENDNRFHKLGYNIQRMAESSLGSIRVKDSIITKNKKSQSNKEWYQNNPEGKAERDKEKSSNWWKQKDIECEFCKKILKQSLIKHHSKVCLENPNRIKVEFSEETRKKLSEKGKLYRHSIASRDKIRIALTGKQKSEAQIAKFKETCRRKKEK